MVIPPHMRASVGTLRTPLQVPAAPRPRTKELRVVAISFDAATRTSHDHLGAVSKMVQSDGSSGARGAAVVAGALRGPAAAGVCGRRCVAGRRASQWPDVRPRERRGVDP